MRAFLPLALLAVVASGCAAPGLTRVRNDFAQSMPEAEIGTGRSFGFGPLMLGLARTFVGDDEDVSMLLGDVSRVRVATYPVHGHFDASSIQTPAALRRLMDRGGWELLVASREEDEVAWVLYRARGERVTDVMTASMDAEELTLTHVSGRLDNVIRNALREHGGDWLQIDENEAE
ncbi:MAG TPA: DUF4252 domain-containing protein [Rhodothermales bacterium]|nr:DUF4252 domain-containing protein [Rhodothermales bacterium]